MKHQQPLESEIRISGSKPRLPAAQDTNQIVVRHSEIEHIALNTWVIWNHNQTCLRQVGARH